MARTVQSNPPPAPAAELQALLVGLPQETALRLRTLANAWQASGGTLHVGRLTIRLIATEARGRPFTAATLRAGRPGEAQGQASLELARILLAAHGVSGAAWSQWCDERPELRAHGFDATDKFPSVRLGELPDAALVRLALGLRDLAHAVAQSTA